MGSSSTKEVNLTKSFDEKEIKALKNCFDILVENDPGKSDKIPSIKNWKTLSLIFSDYNGFLQKLHAWMEYCKKNCIGEEISKKLLSHEGVCSHAFLLSMEVLIKCMTSQLYYSDYARQDPFKLLMYILTSDPKDPQKYFKSNSIEDINKITYKEAEMTFNLIYNFLNRSSDQTYSPFSFLKPMFAYDNKENGDDVDKWEMEYESFRFQLKRVIPFTIKFCTKYLSSQTIYNKDFAVSKSGEVLWSESTINANTVRMPVLKKEILEKSSLISNEIWTTLFLAMPKLEFCKDFDMIYNSGSDGLSFNRLANHIVGYKGPMIFLIKHNQKSSYEEEKAEPMAENCILGAFSDGEIKDNAKFGGNLNSCIFCISPELRVMRTYNNKGGTNYIYLNTVKLENSQYPYGFGFGGSTVEFRMWLDGDNIVDNSYV